MNTKEFLENIHKLNNIDLRFNEIIKETQKYIVVELSGRCLNGSYIYEQEQVSKYLSDLRIAFNGSVEYIGGGNVYTWGKYIFKFEKKTWEEDGKKYSASGYEAFAIGYGETWALMYRIYRALKKYGNVYDFVGLKLQKDKVLFDGKHIFTCTKYKDETYHHFKGHNTDCNRTYFHASFNCYISENEMMKIYIEINKRVLEHNIKIQEDKHKLLNIYYKSHQYSSPSIDYIMSDETFSGSFRVGDTLLVPLKEKTVRNRDLTVQLFKNGDTYISEDDDKDTFTITSVSYNVELGFRYGLFAKRGNSNITCGISQLDLLKTKEPTTNIEYPGLMDIMGLSYYETNINKYRDRYGNEYPRLADIMNDPYNITEKTLCIPKKLNGFSFKEGILLIEGYKIHELIKRIQNKQKQIKDKFEIVLNNIKSTKQSNKNYTKKLEVFNEMFKDIDYGIIDREIKGVGLELGKNIDQCNRYLNKEIENLKMFGKAKRKNLKILSRLENLQNELSKTFNLK